MVLKPLKISLVGLGNISKIQLNVINELEFFELESVIDDHSDKFSSVSQSITRYSSVDEAFSKSDADIFVIATPNQTHFNIILKAIKAGRSVFVEKPICLSSHQLSILNKLTLSRPNQIQCAFHAQYAKDLCWWLDYIKDKEEHLGKLRFLKLGFYDPYIVHDQLIPSATSLSGSWIDSGINALSVVGKLVDIKSVMITDSKMTNLNMFKCKQIQGAAIYSTNKDCLILIDTNWTLGLNQKTTRLLYEHGEFLLDHSNESIFEIVNGKHHLIKSCKDNNERLNNHYKAMFLDLKKRFTQGESNFQNAIQIHKLYLDAIEFRQ